MTLTCSILRSPSNVLRWHTEITSKTSKAAAELLKMKSATGRIQ